MFVVHLVEIGQTTWAPSLEEVLADVQWLACEHLRGLEALGLFEETVKRLGGEIVDGNVAISFQVAVDPAILPMTNGKPMTFDGDASLSRTAAVSTAA